MSKILDCVIVGAGPAGLTAALYAARARLKIKIFEANCVGGQVILTERLDNFPGFPGGVAASDLIEKIRKQISSIGVEVEKVKVEAIEKAKEELKKGLFKLHTTAREYSCRTLIIATGASPRRLGIPGELEFTGKGVSYCATCDGPLFKDKTVAVIGGGNAAVEEAIFLARFVKKLYLVHRRDKLRAVSILQEQLRRIDKCEFTLSSIPLAIVGDSRVRKLEIKNIENNQIRKIDCDGVFIFIGINPNTELVKKFINLDDNGFIIVTNQMQTSEQGVFACGDCVSKDLRQVVTACSDGAQAAFSATNYLIKY